MAVASDSVRIARRAARRHNMEFDMSRTSSQPGKTLDERVAARIISVCDSVGAFIEYWGFKAIHGRIWTLLALRKEPMSQVEIAEFLDVSRSLVSGAVAELTKLGLVKALSDHRNAPYEALVDIWPTISDVLRGREWMLIESARLALESAIEEIELRGTSANWDIDRMRFLLRMTELAQAFLRLLIGIRVPRKLEGLGDWLKSSAKFMRSLRDLR
jgi:DNA-binding transcriptional regulator GbsR (MarR family)